MNRQIRFLLASLVLGAAFLSLTATADGTGVVTRTLQQSINVPAGDSVAVENLVGHMRIVQGNGPLQITATVVAGGDQARLLMQSVKLDVSTSGKRVRVHVHYPVDRYGTFHYSPRSTETGGSEETCILLICFHSRSINTIRLRYQGKRVRVIESTGGGSGAPLYVDVVVHLPAQVGASFSNAAGLLEADGLANNLSLVTQGGNVHVASLRGQLDAHSNGGDIHVQSLHGQLDAYSNGGDIHVRSLHGQLVAHSNGGDIHVQSLSGTLDTHSAGGDVYLGDVSSSDTHVYTDGGDLTSSGLSGDFTLATSSGDAKIDTVAGKVSLNSGSGDARFFGNLSSLQSLDADTGGGDLRVSGNLAGLTSLHADSGGGDIMVRASHLSLHMNASSGGGTVRVHLPDIRNVSSSSDHFSGDIGRAAGRATLRSGGGDITVT